MNISEHIKKLRKTLGFTQATVAESLGMTSQNYNLLENGKTELTYSKIIRLAEIFGVSVVELLGEGASVVVVGGGEGAKEMDALKARLQELESKAILLEKLLSFHEREKNEAYKILLDLLAGQIVEYILTYKMKDFVRGSFIDNAVSFLSIIPNEQAQDLLKKLCKYDEGNDFAIFSELLGEVARRFVAERDIILDMFSQQELNKFITNCKDLVKKMELTIKTPKPLPYELLEYVPHVSYGKHQFTTQQIIDSYQSKIQILEGFLKD